MLRKTALAESATGICQCLCTLYSVLLNWHLPIDDLTIMALANSVNNFFLHLPIFFDDTKNVSAFVERIDFCLLKTNTKRLALCDALNISHTAITDWNRRGTVPAGDIMLRVADYLGVSPWWLVFGEEKPDALSLSQASEPPISREDKKLLSEWHALTAEEKASIQILLDGYTDRHRQEAKKA